MNFYRNPFQNLLLTGILFIIVGAFFAARVIDNGFKDFTASGWPSTEGTIITSEVKEHKSRRMVPRGFSSGRRVSSYSPVVEYRYNVNGYAYTNDVIRFNQPGHFSDIENAEDILAEYPEGETVQVFYNPDDPEESSLEQEARDGEKISLAAGMGALTLGLLLVGFSLLCLQRSASKEA